MFSLIVCSINPARTAAIRQVYEQAFAGHQWEFIHIPDAKSLTSGYNRGVAQSKGDIVLFSHDDMEILSPNLPERLTTHLQKYDLLGIAGTTKLIAPAWFLAGYPYIFGHAAHPGQSSPSLCVAVYNAPTPIVGGIQALDGVLLAARRELLNRVKFDEITFDGWHHYDVDFSYAAYNAGYKVAVACDIAVLHFSAGQFSGPWYTYAERFSQKWFPNQKMNFRQDFVWTSVPCATREDCLRVMSPSYWYDPK